MANSEEVRVTVDQELTNIEVTVNFQEKGNDGKPGEVPVLRLELDDNMILTYTTD